MDKVEVKRFFPGFPGKIPYGQRRKFPPPCNEIIWFQIIFLGGGGGEIFV